MTTKYHQISLKETFSDCRDMFMDDVPSFFQLLEQHFDISLFIPQTFYNSFYHRLGRKKQMFFLPELQASLPSLLPTA